MSQGFKLSANAIREIAQAVKKINGNMNPRPHIPSKAKGIETDYFYAVITDSSGESHSWEEVYFDENGLEADQADPYTGEFNATELNNTKYIANGTIVLMEATGKMYGGKPQFKFEVSMGNNGDADYYDVDDDSDCGPDGSREAVCEKEFDFQTVHADDPDSDNSGVSVKVITNIAVVDGGDCAGDGDHSLIMMYRTLSFDSAGHLKEISPEECKLIQTINDCDAP